MNINLELIKTFNPCDSGLDNYIKHHKDFNGTPLEFLELENIPPSDKLWLILREEFIPERDLHLMACDFAESCLHLFEKEYPNDMRPRQVIQAKRDFIEGKITREELGAAWSVTRSVARSAAESAAWSAAWSVARSVARSAAWSAACSAARGVVYSAAESEQVNYVIGYFKNKQEGG